MIHSSLWGQITGTVADEADTPLPFATIFVEGTSHGTTSNENGNFRLSGVKPGDVLIFRYIGYHDQKRVIQKEQEDIGTIRLNPAMYELGVIEVRADAEDPAYAMIRKAMEKRTYYLNRFDTYRCEAYIKGVMRIESLPEAIMSRLEEDADAEIGIIYLSETHSRLEYFPPDGLHEEIIYARTSGTDQGISFNTALLFRVNFYENFQQFGTGVPSPISNVAMTHYRYRLLGSRYNEDGRLIHRIEVIARNPAGPAWSGELFLMDEYWLITEARLWVAGKNIQMDLLDTLTVVQTHLPVEGNDGYLPGNQQLLFQCNILGIRFGGYFTGIFSNYETGIPLLKPRNKIMINYRDTAFLAPQAGWSHLRPIPLTDEETENYRVSDSLFLITSQPAYMDSTDRVANRFNWLDLATGYTWRKRTLGTSFSIASPLQGIEFNAVSGISPGISGRFNQSINKNQHQIYIRPEIYYGFADEVWRYRAEAGFRLGRRTPWNFSAGISNRLRDYDPGHTIGNFGNTWLSLQYKQNYKKWYGGQYIFGSVRSPEVYALAAQIRIESGVRNAPQNQSDFSFRKRNRTYEPNLPLQHPEVNDYFSEHRYNAVEGVFRWKKREGYIRYPGQIVPIPSNLPEIQFRVRYSVTNTDELTESFAHGEIRVTHTLTFGTYGESYIRGIAGGFLLNRPQYFMDYKHFHGNQINYMDILRFRDSYKQLPYYRYSTSQNYLQWFYEHSFKGAGFRHIPGIRDLGLSPVVSFNGFILADGTLYKEASVGIDRIGFGALRIFRVDLTAAWLQGEFKGMGFVLSSGIKVFMVQL